MKTTQWDENMLAALDELDQLTRVTVISIVTAAMRHNVDADDLFEAWCDE